MAKNALEILVTLEERSRSESETCENGKIRSHNEFSSGKLAKSPAQQPKVAANAQSINHYSFFALLY